MRILRVLRGPSDLVRALRVPIQNYIHTEEVGAFILLAAAAAALGWVNSPWADSYGSFWHNYISIDIGIFHLHENLGHLVNDGLMAIFFFLVGLEIKRELLHGELSSFRKAFLPTAAAAGGMVVPALVYVAFNGTSGAGAAGWGIPMATDIAFALGVLALLGRRAPAELRVFLLGLAVVDDLGAIGVIAVFYSDAISWSDLGLAIAVFAIIAVCIRLGVRSLGFYVILSIVMWQFLLESGIHATLAGVALAAVVPSKPYIQREVYAAAVEVLLTDYRQAIRDEDNEKAEAITAQIERLSSGTEGPMERLEGQVHPWVSFVILPVFALANAGIVFTSGTLSAALESSVTLGVFVALPVGKAIGVLGATWLAVRLGVSGLPAGVSWAQVLGVGLLSGIGFTVAIFISGIAFSDPAVVDQAKMGVFAASVLAGVVGYVVLRWVGGRGADAE
ncbi:MAG: Na+/H+ antiporter NhaA [Chloroflexi bacterium]|nr:Na+/H+ antiporter NhaA [Chloroflexota bacterium]